MLLTGKEPAQQLYAQIDQRISAAATVPGLFALYDPEDVPAGWYLRSIQRAGEAHGIPVIAHPLAEGWALPEQGIGHGHHIFEDRELCARAIRDGVTLEVCPTSNIQCSTRPSYEEHPLKKLMDMGVSCTINTDNMILSDIDLDKEYDRCIGQMGLTVQDIIRCNINSVRASFMAPAKKLKLIDELLAALEACAC